MLLLKQSFVASIALLLIACQSQAPHVDEEEQVYTASWQVLESDLRCFPVDDDAFDHPIDYLPLPTAPNESIWPRVQAGLTLPYVDNQAVKQQLDWYVRNPKYFERVQKRSSRYLYFIIEELHRQNVPFDIAFLPIVESAFEPFAYSHGQASGLWQFIPMTGHRFKLQQNWWIDERRDPVESTRAAIKYLKYLNGYFDGDWLLAIAAYNAGEGRIRRAINKNIAAGLPTDFWSLDLPSETSAYVPKMLALSEIFRQPEKYNISLLKIANQAYFAPVILNSQLDLSQAAELADINIDEVYYLNSGLNRWATPPGNYYELKLPISQIELFAQALEQLPASARVTWHRHTIKSGESLGLIAQNYNTEIAVIKEANRLSNNTIVAGKVLMIPASKNSKGSYIYDKSSRTSKKQNTQPKSGLNKAQYTVQRGDTFWGIAKKYGVDIQALAKWNGKSPKDTLKLGEKLVVWHKGEKQAHGFRQAKVSKVNYQVRSGDSLGKLASKFNVKVSQIVGWNDINPKKYLYPGQKLTLYVNVMETY